MPAFQYEEGSSGSSSSSQNSSQSGTLPFYNKQVEELLKRGVTQSQAPYQAYGGQLVAGFQPVQNQAFGALQGAVGDWQPGLQQAQQGLGQAQNIFSGLLNSPYTAGALGQIAGYTGRAQYDPRQINQYMNPYMSNVVGEIGRLGQEQFTQQTMPQLQSAFGDAGQFGSSRNAAFLADAAAKSQREISQAQSNALAGGFNQAMQNYGDWSNRSISAGQNAANQMMGLNQFTQGLGTSLGGLAGQQAGIAGQQQQMGLTDVNALFGAGKQQQDLAQNQLNSQYQQFQQQQQYPWQQLNNLAGLFKVPTPQSATSSGGSSQSSYNNSWGTSFKRGGLARVRKMADGGDFNWQISPEEQFRRDQMRGLILAQEAEQYPEDENLMLELGAHNQRMMADPLSQQLFSLPEEPMAEEPIQLAEAPTSSVTDVTPNPMRMVGRGGAVRIQDLLAQQIPGIFDERKNILETIRSIPSLQPLPERSTMDRIGEAMMRSGAQGPANWGQMLGRAGAAFYDREDADAKENQARALARLKLEESVVPEIGKIGAGGGIGRSGEYKQARGVDGSVWMVNSLDPSDKQLVSEGSYAKQINELAERRAREIIKDGVYKTVEEKEAAIKETTERIRDELSEKYALGSEKPGIQPTTGAGAATVPGPSGAPTSGAATPINTPQEGSKGADSGAVPAAKSPGTMIQTPQEVKESEQVGTGLGKQYMTLQEDATNARGKLHQIDRLEQLYAGVNSGKLTPLGTELAAWASAFGIKGIDKNLPNKQAAESIASQFALELRNPSGGAGMPGSLSDSDRQFLRSMVPNLSLEPESIKLMLETYRKLSERSIEVAKLARQYRRENPRKSFDEDFYDYLEDHFKDKNLFGDTEQTGTSGASVTQRGPKRIRIAPEDLR